MDIIKNKLIQISKITNNWVHFINYHSLSLLKEFMQDPQRLSQTHILKIVLKGKTFRPDVGIKTYPKQTYGISP